MNNIIIEIKGNKFTKKDIDNMIIDYINIGKYYYYKKNLYAETLLKEFIKKYKNNGTSIIILKKRNIKNYLSSAMLLFKLGEFYFYPERYSYGKYMYILCKLQKGTKVTEYHIDSKIVICHNSIPAFLENWYIREKFGVMEDG